MSPQGKKGNPAGRTKSKAVSAPRSSRGLALIVFGVLFVGLFVIVAAAQGLGEPSVPDGAIAVVEDAPNGTITTDEYDRALVQAAARQGLKEVPATDDPQYDLLSEAAESDLILARWVLGEAAERGIEITDREIDAELEKVKKDQFGSQKAFDKFLEQSGFTLDEAKDRIKLQLISDSIQQTVLPAEPDVTEEEIQNYYDANMAQFEQPETRDVRVLLTKTQADAEKALAELGTDPSPKTWQAVVKKYSIDEATQSTGGLRQGVVAGQSEPALDDEVFAAAEGELTGPFKGDAGFYVIQVEAVTPAVTQQLDDPIQQAAQGAPAQTVSDQIRATLVATRQQEIAQAFQDDFQSKWVERTICADGFRIDRCSNPEPTPNPCTKEVAETQGCDAVVPSTKPIAPGSNAVFGAPPAVGLPQGPISSQDAATPEGGLPPGLTPAPGGAAPPGTVPPGAAPQQAPPPAPPGG